MNDAGYRLADQLADCVAELFRAERIYRQNLAGGVDNEVHGGVVVEDILPLVLALPKFGFRPLPFGDVHDGAYELEVVPVGFNGVGRHANVLDPAVGQAKAVLVGKIAAVLRCVRHDVSEVGDVLWMYPVANEKFDGGRHRWIELENAESFRRPVNPAARGMPAEAARLAQILCLSQVRLAAPQSLFNSPPLAVLLLQIRIGPLQVRIKVGVLQRDRRLGGEQG